MFIDKNKIRFNIYEACVIDDQTIPAGFFLDADQRAIHGITEIPDPIPPANFSDVESIWTDTDTEPYFVITARNPEQVERSKAIASRDIAQRFLDTSDYLFTTDRYAELCGEEPGRAAELTTQRAESRAIIRAFKAKYPEPM